MGGAIMTKPRCFMSFASTRRSPTITWYRIPGLYWTYPGSIENLRPYYSEIGRPSIDRVLMIRMLGIGYVFAIRSQRQICREVEVNLAYRWFCGLEEAIPNHSSFSRQAPHSFL